MSTHGNFDVNDSRETTESAQSTGKTDETYVFPVSFQQEQLWYLDEVAPGSPVYVVPLAWRLRGSLSRSALEDSLKQVVRRHEALRTSFDLVDGEPSQIVHESIHVRIPFEDVSNSGSASERYDEAVRMARQDAEAPFDLSKAPLLRARLIRIGPDDHLFVIVLHHIVFDDWSYGILVDELAGHYASAVRGERLESVFPEPTLQYADFTVWQRELVETEEFEEELAFWREQLGGRLPPLELPTDRNRPPVQTFRGETIPIRIPGETLTGLRALARAERATLFMTLLAAYDLLLHRLTGQDDILVGTPTAGRSEEGLESTIGFFVNALTLRTDVSGSPSFRQLLQRVRRTVIASLSHERTPFRHLVVELQPERDLSRNALFQTMFTLQTAPKPKREFPGLSRESVSIPIPISKFDARMELTENEASLDGFVEFNLDLFDRTTAEQLFGCFETLLQHIARNPDQVIDEIPLLGALDRAEILRQWTSGDTRDTPEESLVELFEFRAREASERIAVSVPGDDGAKRSISYADLNARANRVAHALRARGIERGDLVGIYMERSLEVVEAVLGILKAGAAYLPLDPIYPADRLAFMLQDSGVKLILSQTELVSRILSPPVDVICLDEDTAELREASTENPDPVARPEDPAYVIYTSGSTGKPKGVPLAHANVVRLFTATSHWFDFDEQDVWTLFHSYAFDFSVWEIWGALLHGGRLVVVPHSISRSSDDFCDLIAREGVTVLNQTPSAFRELIQSDRRRDSAEGYQLRWIIFGGEALDLQSLRPWFERHGDSRPRIVNMYGITETCVHVTYRPIGLPDLEGGARSLIGGPIPDLQLYLLDANREPVPNGVPGEIYVGGAGVARGYLNRPELTAERFLPNPFRPDDDGRLYRSGDLARCNSRGELEYLGRIDHQVQVRGFRIELGEIESALSDHPNVRECVASVLETRPGDVRIVVHYVPEDLAHASHADLRNHLRTRLPEYMIPGHLVDLDAMPLTPNGKIDRRALPAPDGGSKDTEFVAPRSETEKLLASVWQREIGVERVGVFDNFFDLGGHSLLLLKVRRGIEDVLGHKVPMVDLLGHPTVESLAEHLGEGRGSTTERAEEEPSIEPVDRSAYRIEDLAGEPALVFPVSYQQEQLWYLDQVAPGLPTYNVSQPWRLRGTLSVTSLESSLRELVRRHEALRTSFGIVDGQLSQIVHEALDFHLAQTDVASEDAEAEAHAEALRLVHEEARRPFDLSDAPLFRAKLIRVGRDDHMFVLTVHHSVFDGRSMEIVFKELALLYEAALRGRDLELALPEARLQNADFAVWQHEFAETPWFQHEVEYWRSHLESPLSPLEIPTDRNRPPVQTFRGKSLPIRIPRETLVGLQELARQERATLFMVLLSAYVVLLHRYCGQDDLVVGAPTEGRGDTGLRDTVGYFVNTLPLRTDASGDPSFLELLQQVKRTVAESLAQKRVPLERLVQELKPERDLSRNPFFQTAFVLQPAQDSSVQLSGLVGDPILVSTDTAKFDLMITVTMRDSGLGGYVEFNTDLFDQATIEHFRDSFRAVLDAVCAAPGNAISRIPILSDAQFSEIVDDRGDTAEPYSRERCLHELIEEQAVRMPDSIAVVHRDSHLTYRQLTERAALLAGHLRGLDVGRDTLVGLCMERSADMVVAALGIMMAGGAYLPLDPAYPSERIRFILEDAQAPVVVTQESLRAALPETTAKMVFMDTDWEMIGSSGPVDSTGDTGPENLAYVIYTSGSTGNPKGVEVPHRAVVNFLATMARRPGLSADDILLAVTTMSFDISVLEIFLPLVVGSRTVVVDSEVVADGERLMDVLESSGATVMQATPSTWRLLLTDGWRGEKSLKTLCGGEALRRDLAKDLVPRVGSLWNMYGPTETTVWSTCYRIEDPDGPILIGRPIGNTQVYVLDQHMQPTPVGVVGELYVGGDGVTRGYRNRPESTAKSFVPSPFGAGRLYRTGDAVRLRADGNLEYLNRLDAQVKVRGFRIELGEIEAVLADHDDVAEGAASVYETQPGDARLVAYYVPQAGTSTTASELRNHLREKLPVYMIPSHMVELEAIPRTPNGKIDRKALPKPEGGSTETEFVAPRSGSEKLLARVWEQELGVDRVGVLDNFFDLGGHSLLLLRVRRGIEQALRHKVPLLDLLAHPTIESLAAHLGDSGGVRTDDLDELPIERVDRSRHRTETADGRSVLAFPVSHQQEQLWYIDQVAPGMAVYNSLEIRRLRGELSVSSLERSLEELVRRHESLRTSFGMVDGQLAQIVHDSVDFQLRLAEVPSEVPSLEAHDHAVRLAQEEARAPFDLSNPPLIRAKLIRAATDDHVLVVTIHHTVFDERSGQVLFEELSSFYEAATKGLDVEQVLPEPRLHGGDFAVWQRQLAETPSFEQELAYWRSRLEGPIAPLELPTDRSRPPAQTFAGDSILFRFPPETLRDLRELARKEEATLFMVCLAAYLVLLHRYSGQDDLVIGTPTEGREDPGLQDVFGFFVNTLVLRTDASGNPSFSELLQRVKRTVSESLANARVPLERLVAELKPERDMSRNPFFQTSFMFQHQKDAGAGLVGLQAEWVPPSTGTSKFDVMVSLVEQESSLVGGLEFNTDLFDRATIERFLDSYRAILGAIAADPKAGIRRIPLLSEEQRYEIVEAFNDTGESYPRDRRLHDLIWEQAERTPGAVALVHGDQQLTYRQLTERATTLANHLRELHVGPDTLVGHFLERSTDMVVAALGILKAGAAYLPLDPAYPPDRIAFILEDAKAPVLVTQESLQSKLPETSAIRLCLDTDWDAIAASGPVESAPGTGPENLAYVIYTSGSTGKPKGVEVPHRAAVNFVTTMARRPGLSASDVMLAVTTLSFDMSVFELFLPLSVGARVVIADSDAAADGERLMGLLDAAGATILQATPSTWRILHTDGWRGAKGLKAVSGGEALPRDLVRSLVPRVDSFWNGYGPTETTVYSSCYHVRDPEGPILIGRPVGNTQTYVLDPHMQLVPVGVVGELFIGGDGVTRGYRERPALTAERFVPNPFGDGRLCRTGDAVRHHADGNLEYLHRLDEQVKVRGFRVELGEVEAVLSDHADVKECVASVREAKPGDTRLLAHYVPRDGAYVTSTDLRKHMRTRLPEYMVPGNLVELEALPLTPNGKVDRKALPQPGAVATGVEFVAPRTEREKYLADIWAEEVGVDRVGIHDNFFELGGHSLLSMKMIARVREGTGVRIPPRLVLFNTLEHIARALDEDHPLEVAASASTSPMPAKARGPLGWLKRALFR